jgi:hypothetical protein
LNGIAQDANFKKSEVSGNFDYHRWFAMVDFHREAHEE